MNKKSKKEEFIGFISRHLLRKSQARPWGAHEWFQNGFEIMHSSNDYESAIKSFSSCIELDCSHARAFLSRGISYESINNTEAALHDFSKAIELLPEDGKAYYMKGMLLWRLCDTTAIDVLEMSAKLGYIPARDFLSKKTSQHNKSSQDNFDQSLKEEAIMILTESIRLDPLNAGTYLNRGMAYERINNMQQAIADYSKAIELASDCARAYYLRGTTLWFLDDDTSIKDLMMAVELGYQPAQEFLDQNTHDR